MSATPDQPPHDASLVEQFIKRVREDPSEAALLEFQLRWEADEADRVMRAWSDKKALPPLSEQVQAAIIAASTEYWRAEAERERAEEQASRDQRLEELRRAFNPGRPGDDPSRREDKECEERGKQAYLAARMAGQDQYHAKLAAMEASGRKKSWVGERYKSWEA